MSLSPINLQSYFIPLKEIELATNNFCESTCIGEGGFGKVYKGPLSASRQNRTAAFKCLHDGKKELFLKEIEMMASLHHDNIVSFIGYCDEESKMIIVSEYVVKGSLDDHLYNPTKRRCLSWTQRLKICLGVARALNYLHSGIEHYNRVIHRDVKSANILLDDKFVAKVSDFGLSVAPINQQVTRFIESIAGTDPYIDPSYRESHILSRRVDVYSFGVVLFEIMSGLLAYHRWTAEDGSTQQLVTLVRQCDCNDPETLIDPDIRNQIHSDSFKKLKNLAYQCIGKKDEMRPAMDKVVTIIEDALVSQLKVNFSALIEFVMEDSRFRHCKPVAAYIIFETLLHWNILESKRSSVFSLLIGVISKKNKAKKDYVQMTCWLSFASTLLFLIEKSLNLEGESSVQTTTPPAIIHVRETEADARNPVLHLRNQLTQYVKRMCTKLSDEKNKELEPLLASCIEDRNQWNGIIDILETHLNILEKNCVPTLIIQNTLTDVFSYINMQLLHCFLKGIIPCSYESGNYAKAGLEKLRLWCSRSIEATSRAWDGLIQIKEAVDFLVLQNKETLTYHDITRNICPNLNPQQLKQLCSKYYNLHHHHRTALRIIFDSIRMATNTKDASIDPIHLEDSATTSVTSSDNHISSSLQVQDFANMISAIELATYQDFHILSN